MAELCYVCHEPCPVVGTLHVGSASVGDEDVALCPDCAEHVFPGFCESMRAECPQCAKERAVKSHRSV